MTSILGLPEAEQLAHALVAKLASEAGIRILAIKGQVADRYELREPRVAADADVIVDPQSFDALCRLLEGRGWHQRVARETPSLLPQHSRTYIHPQWPCDIDMHWMFPGFFASAQAAFDALWQGHTTMELAHRPILVPSRSGAAVIGALHARRNVRSPRHVAEGAEIDRLVATEFSPSERAEFYGIASQGGAVWVLQDLITREGLGPVVNDANQHDRAMWALNRTFADEGSALGWWLEMGKVPWRRRPAVLVRALWVPRSKIPRNSQDVVPTRRDALGYQITRWQRGIRAVTHYLARRR